MPKNGSIQYCAYCGDEMGVWNSFSTSYDTCGKRECDRDAKDCEEEERGRAHEELDMNMGWR